MSGLDKLIEDYDCGAKESIPIKVFAQAIKDEIDERIENALKASFKEAFLQFFKDYFENKGEKHV